MNTSPSDLEPEGGDVRDAFKLLAPTSLPDADEVAVARERLEWRLAHRPQPPQPSQPHTAPVIRFATRVSTPWRVAAGGLAAALVVAAVVAFTPEGSSAAAAFLAQFRSQQVSAIEITPQSQADIMKSLNALGNLGSVEVPGSNASATPQQLARSAAGQTRTVSAAEAAQAVGLPALLTPDPATLPSGVSATPTYRVSAGSEFKFRFDKNKARAYYQSIGQSQVNLPDKFDGETLSVTMPAAALLNYGTSSTSSREDLVVVEAGELVVDVQGNASLPEMRDFLLTLPGLPPAVVSQLKQIQNWNETLPIPVPVDQVNWQKATIRNTEVLLLNDNSGIGSAAVWHANGHLFGVAGSVKADALKSVVESLIH